MTYLVTFSKKALKDYEELKRQGLKDKVDSILAEISNDPFSLPSKRLKGEVSDLYSRRLNRVDRIVYSVEEKPDESFELDGIINVVRMRTHYQGILPSFIF